MKHPARWLGALGISAALALGWWEVWLEYLNYEWTSRFLGGLYSHGLMAFAIASILIVRQLRHCSEGNTDTPWAGVAVLTLGVLLKVHGEWMGYTALRGLSLIPTLAGLLWIFIPAPQRSRMVFPVAYLLFAIPPPTALIDAAVAPLRSLHSATTSAALLALDLPIERSGYSLIVMTSDGTQREVFIDAACSGLGSTLTLLALATLLLYSNPTVETPKRILLGLLMIPLAVAANSLRILLTTLAAFRLDISATQRVHDLLGLPVFVGALLLLLVPLRLASHLPQRPVQ